MMTPSDGARAVAHKAFRVAKWFESQESPAGPWRERMRNAWVAYHHGASWLLPPGYEDMLRGSIGLGSQYMDEAQRLRAEVERLRKRLHEVELRASMACEQQPCGDCPGCAIAEEQYGADALARGDGASDE